MGGQLLFGQLDNGAGVSRYEQDSKCIVESVRQGCIRFLQ